MVKKKYVYFKEGESASMDDLDKLLRVMPISGAGRFTEKCRVIVETSQISAKTQEVKDE